MKFIRENTVGTWASPRRHCVARTESKASGFLGYGFGFGFRIFGDKFNINRLDVEKLTRDTRRAPGGFDFGLWRNSCR